jgi:hypothetical protein
MPLFSMSGGDDEGYAGNPALRRTLFDQALRAQAPPPPNFPPAGRIPMSPSQLNDYTALVRNPQTQPAALEAWGHAQGYPISNASDILGFVRQNPNATLSDYFQQPAPTPQSSAAPSPPSQPGLASRLMGSFNEGMADSLGGAVDMANWGMKHVGIPTSPNPIMGSDWIRSIMHSGNVGAYSKAYDPQNTPEYYGQQFARGFGQAAVPTGGRK